MELDRPDFDPSDDELVGSKKKSKKSKKTKQPIIDIAEMDDTQKTEPKSFSDTLDELFRPKPEDEDEDSEQELKDEIDQIEEGEVVDDDSESVDLISEYRVETLSVYPTDEEVTVSLDEINVEHEILLRPSDGGLNKPSRRRFSSKTPRTEASSSTSISAESTTVQYDTETDIVSNEVNLNPSISAAELERLIEDSQITATEAHNYDSKLYRGPERYYASHQISRLVEDRPAVFGQTKSKTSKNQRTANISQSSDRKHNPAFFSVPETTVNVSEGVSKQQLTSALRSEHAYSRHHDEELQRIINQQEEEIRKLRQVQQEDNLRFWETQQENQIIQNHPNQELEVGQRNLEAHKDQPRINELAQLDQGESLDQRVELPDDHRLEQSAWHRIELDSKTGKVVESPTIAYGQEFKREQGQEMWRETAEPAIPTSQSTADLFTNLGTQQPTMPIPQASTPPPSPIQHADKPTVPTRDPDNRVLSNTTDAILWVVFILVIFAITAVAIL
jgi:hypothetical protein